MRKRPMAKAMGMPKTGRLTEGSHGQQVGSESLRSHQMMETLLSCMDKHTAVASQVVDQGDPLLQEQD
jgi:hypothetical protein